jgi:ABC-type uncharacterized transport system involved in gliding motility auxiliary subunit
MEVRRFAPIAGVIGGILALASVVINSLAPGHEWLVLLTFGLGACCLILFLVSYFHRLKEFSARRSTRLGANSFLMVAMFVGILGIVNILAARHDKNWDLSETQSFTLAPQTHKVLRSLKQDVRVMVFAQDRSPGSNAYRDLLDSYRGATDRVTVEFVDPERRPDEARKHGITRLNTAVLESGTETVRITTPSEAELTSALIRVTRDTKKRILFLEGHGEHSLNDRERTGYETVKEALTKQGYDVGSLSLLQESAVPDNTSVLVIGGPQRVVTADERERLKQFVAKGGRLLIMVDPEIKTGLDELLQQWGVTLGPGVLVDMQDRLALGDLTALLVRTFTEHEITQDLNSAVLMPSTRHLLFSDEAAKEWDFVPLARTSPRSWAETELDGKVISFNTGKDVQGPLPLAGALTPKKAPAEGQPRPAVVVVGNSTFASNAYVNFPGNTDFFLHVIGWLAQERDLVSITPKEPAFRPFVPNPNQERILLYVQVLLLPTATFFYGLSVWRRRRRL